MTEEIMNWHGSMLTILTVMLPVAALAQTADPTVFDAKYAGYYQQDTETLHFFRQRDHYYAQGTGQPPVELKADNPTQFSAAPGTLTFEMNVAGQVTDVILQNRNGRSVLPRIDTATAEAIEAQQKQAASRTMPNPGTEDALKRQIVAFEKGMPDYDGLAEPILSKVHSDPLAVTAIIAKLGPLHSLRFKSAMASGADVFEVTFEYGGMEWVVSPLTPDGKISHFAFKPPGAG
jgi:hypothetical protein